jgi:hypothetical protein
MELVRLAARVLKGIDAERPADATPLAVAFLAIRLEGIAERGVLDADALESARAGAYRGRCLDLHRAFGRYNPGFGPVHSGGWGRLPTEAQCQATAQRRELALCLGDRVADLLDPPAGPGGWSR